MSYSWQRRDVCVRDRRAYTTMYSSNKNKWAQSLEERERARSCFSLLHYGKKRRGERVKRKKYKKGVCVLSVHFLGCIQRLSTQLPACVPAHECSAYSPTCVSNERWTALLSILSSKISHDVTMNPSWTHLCQKALLQPSLSLPHFLFHLSLLHGPFLPLEFFSELPFFFFPFSYFRILQHFPSAVHVSSLSPSSLTEAHNLFFFCSFGKHGLIESPKSATVCQKCQDVLIIINFV